MVRVVICIGLAPAIAATASGASARGQSYGGYRVHPAGKLGLSAL